MMEKGGREGGGDSVGSSVRVREGGRERKCVCACVCSSKERERGQIFSPGRSPTRARPEIQRSQD
jgi:hypothetical protein